MRIEPANGRAAAAVVWCLVVLFAAAACSGGTPAPTNPQPTSARSVGPPPTVAPTKASGPTGSTEGHETPPVPTDTLIVEPTPTPGPFGRHDSPPDGVDAEFPWITPRALTCRFVFKPADTQPQANADQTLELPGNVRLCFFGFDANQPIEVTITAPDGSTSNAQPVVDIEGDLEAYVTRVPGDPEGVQSVNARQGDREAATSFEVVPPSLPKGIAVPNPTRVGDTVTIWFGGLEPGALIPAYLYRLDGGAKFIADLGQINVDDRGFASIVLSSSASDELGGYLIWAQIRVAFTLVP